MELCKKKKNMCKFPKAHACMLCINVVFLLLLFCRCGSVSARCSAFPGSQCRPQPKSWGPGPLHIFSLKTPPCTPQWRGQGWALQIRCSKKTQNTQLELHSLECLSQRRRPNSTLLFSLNNISRQNVLDFFFFHQDPMPYLLRNYPKCPKMPYFTMLKKVR